MKRNLKSSAQSRFPSARYRTRTPRDLSSLDPKIAQSFTPQQLEAVTQGLKRAAQPSPKLVDLRFTVDLLFSRFYLVILVGKDRRQHRRDYAPSKLAQAGNWVAAVVLLIGANLVASAAIVLIAYLIKSAVGIDVFSDRHIADVIQEFWR
ncbi:MAG: hypothetical protein ACFB4I_00585 [Cyanophyceae cyanobacterium]